MVAITNIRDNIAETQKGRSIFDKCIYAFLYFYAISKIYQNICKYRKLMYKCLFYLQICFVGFLWRTCNEKRKV